MTKKEYYKNIKKGLLVLCSTGLITGCSKESVSNPHDNGVIQTEIDSTTFKEKPTTEEITTEIIKEIMTTIKETDSTKEVTTTSNNNETKEIMDYISVIGDEIDSSVDTISAKAKSCFITLVDFRFYGGTIGGKTYDSLSASGKEMVNNSFSIVSNKMYQKFPSFTALIAKTYSKFSNYSSEKWGLVKDWFKEKLGEENSEKLSEFGSENKEKLKEWYENFKNK